MAILEKHMRIYNDDCGSYVEVKPDADGLGLIELNHVENDGKNIPNRGFVVTKEEALLLIKALEEVLVNNPSIE